ncbi:MAG TPA: bacillithiol biosynthesis cysteine-adding enzyme BshC [Bryobacteraceae bacterium]|nr:bacillithiol biosynthesis cysteine-adding enzyme BshC [Bryobacteraceae bacterium]
MHCSCVRHTELPHTSALFADVLYHPDRTSDFYQHPLRDLDDFREAAAAIRFTPEQRGALVAALRERNPEGEALRKLAQPDTVAVVTGQQVGLFSGPSYTLYKVLHAIKLAEWLTEQGLPAVPMFWLATEDHDFAEVNHAWVFDRRHTPIKLEMRRTASAQPVGGVALANPPLREFRAALHGLPFGEEVADLVEETYRAGNTMGQAFSELLRRILARFDVPQVDPMLPVFRELAAPALAAAVERGAELTTRVLERNKQLAAAGYHAQVHVEEQTSFFFLLENGKRLALRRHGDEYILNGRRFSLAELAARAASLSPNALLRPVVQDSMLPTVAYIGGPAEVAYLAQSAVLYDAILGRMPLAIPRTGFTLLDTHSEKLLHRYGLSLADFFHGEDALRERVAARLAPPALTTAMGEAASAVDGAIDRLRRELASFDPTLAVALERSARKMRYQLDKVERKAGREALRRDARAAQDAASLCGLLYPERHLQERLYSILPFLAKHGFDLVDHVYEAIQLDCVDHRLMVL